MPAKRTTLRLNNERQQLLEEASEIIADGPEDDPPMTDGIDAALTHLVESEQQPPAATIRRNIVKDRRLISP